jgi:hypothetical protein
MSSCSKTMTRYQYSGGGFARLFVRTCHGVGVGVGQENVLFCSRTGLVRDLAQGIGVVNSYNGRTLKTLEM